MMQLLTAIENSSFPTFIRESPSVLGYPTILAIHTFGMAFLVGPNVAVALRVLGIAPRLPLAPLERYFPLMWVGFWVNAVSGVALTLLTPAKFLALPAFYIKLLAIACAVVNLRLLRSKVFSNSAKLDTRPVPAEGGTLAVASFVLWGVAIVAGKVMEYDTYIQVEAAIAVLVVLAMILVARFFIFGSLVPGTSARQNA